MQIYYSQEGSEYMGQYPWFAFQKFSDGQNGYLAIAETESELLAYLGNAYPQAIVIRESES